MLKYAIFISILLLANLTLIFTGGLNWVQSMLHPEIPETIVSAQIFDVFTFTLEEEVKKKIGQPVEGYEPQMFLQVFPGLAETDFEGVKASSGIYTIEQGKLVFKADPHQLMHSASTAISSDGMKILLENVALRTHVDLSHNGTITDIMSALVAR